MGGFRKSATGCCGKEESIESHRLRELLSQVQGGEVAVEEALARLRLLPYEDLGFAKLDHHRSLRRGFPEVVFGEGKRPEQVVAIAERLATQADRLLITRVGPEVFDAISRWLPDAVYHPEARLVSVERGESLPRRAGVAVVSAGTSDLPVAEEAAVTAELMGNAVERVYDIGVAGIHRLLDHLPQLHKARVIVAVAGMEGALPSVVGGLVSVPVIGVPTSVGYGASFGGITPLLAMLNSCVPGVSVVNIDNGFGAGYLAALINLGLPG